MTIKRKSLGRNLSALLGQPAAAEYSKPQENHTILPIAALQAGTYQPRQDFNETTLQELADSIQQQGILQPLIVRELTDNRYEIIAGERRFRAALLAQLTEVPAIIKTVDNQGAMAIALIENLQRDDLNAVEEARAMSRLTQEFGLTHQEIANLLGKSRAAVSNALRLLTLPDAIICFVDHGDLDMGHVRPLIGLEPGEQIRIAQHIVAHNLSVRETEQLINRMKNPKLNTRCAEPLAKIQFDTQITQLKNQLNTKVSLKQQNSGKGTLQIHFNSTQDLSLIFEKLT